MRMWAKMHLGVVSRECKLTNGPHQNCGHHSV